MHCDREVSGSHSKIERIIQHVVGTYSQRLPCFEGSWVAAIIANSVRHPPVRAVVAPEESPGLPQYYQGA